MIEGLAYWFGLMVLNWVVWAPVLLVIWLRQKSRGRRNTRQ